MEKGSPKRKRNVHKQEYVEEDTRETRTGGGKIHVTDRKAGKRYISLFYQLQA